MIIPLLSKLAECNSSQFPPSLYNCVDRNEIASLSEVFIILVNAIKIILALAGVVAVIMVVVGAIQYTTSQGNPQQTAQAKSTLANVVVGLILIIGSYAIINFIAGIF